MALAQSMVFPYQAYRTKQEHELIGIICQELLAHISTSRMLVDSRIPCHDWEMEAPKFPLGNTVTPLGIVAAIVARFAGEWITVADWWQNLPWVSIALLLAGVMIGQTWADLANLNSQLRRWWSYRARSFEITAIGRNRTDVADNESIEIFCVLKFVRNLSNPLLTVRVVQLLARDQRRITVVHQERLGEVVKDKSLRLRLGTVSKALPGAKAAYHSIWGSELPTAELKHGQLSIVGGNKEIIEISVNRQVYKIYAEPIMNLDLRVILLAEDDLLSRILK
jgi:hypothetical protein